MKWSKEILDAKSVLENLESKVLEKKIAIASMQQEFLLDFYGIAVGDVIISKHNKKEYVFTRFDNSEWSQWAYGRLVKKDGTPAANEHCLYSDWEKK